MSHHQNQHCIDACEACAAACDHCSTACLKEAEVARLARCIELDIQCAQFCRLAAGAMARGSEFVGAICQLCAEICDACGEECVQHEMDHCQECARACRDCAQACRQMAGEGAATPGRHGIGAGAH